MHAFCVVVAVWLVGCVWGVPISQYPNAPVGSLSNGTAFAFTGAGGRIGQLTALAESLVNGTATGTPIRPAYLAGVSSGALVSIAFNAIFENLDNNLGNGFDFGRWQYILFTTTNDDIYDDSKLKLISNVDDGYFLDSDPLKSYASHILNSINYTVLGDLYLPTYITVVDQRSGTNVRLFSRNPDHFNIPLIDVIMATTAIPVAFPPRMIEYITPNTQFIDGGTGIDYVPIVPLINDGGVHTIYAITYNQAFSYATWDDSEDASHGTLVKYALQAYSIQGANIAVGALEVLRNSAVVGMVYEPNFTETFSITDFNSMEQQYNLARTWAASNSPVAVQNLDLLRPNQQLPNYTTPDVASPHVTSSGSVTLAGFGIALVALAMSLGL